MIRKTIKSRVLSRISRSKYAVFLRKDFSNIAGYDQIGLVLKQLVDDEKLIKIGYGLYCKARINRINGKIMCDAKGGFSQVSQEALTRLGVNWQPSEAYLDYQNGSSTQIPANAEVVIFDRFQRNIGVDGFTLSIAAT